MFGRKKAWGACLNQKMRAPQKFWRPKEKPRPRRSTVPQLEAADQVWTVGLCFVVPFLALPLAAGIGIIAGVC